MAPQRRMAATSEVAAIDSRIWVDAKLDSRHKSPEGPLNDATVSSEWVHMIGLIKEPEPMPLFAQGPQVFRRKNQLTRSNSWIGIVNWQKAPNNIANRDCQQRREYEPTHSISSVKTVSQNPAQGIGSSLNPHDSRETDRYAQR
jgi:hypothetical protein